MSVGGKEISAEIFDIVKEPGKIIINISYKDFFKLIKIGARKDSIQITLN